MPRLPYTFKKERGEEKDRSSPLGRRSQHREAEKGRGGGEKGVDLISTLMKNRYPVLKKGKGRNGGKRGHGMGKKRKKKYPLALIPCGPLLGIKGEGEGRGKRML